MIRQNRSILQSPTQRRSGLPRQSGSRASALPAKLCTAFALCLLLAAQIACGRPTSRAARACAQTEGRAAVVQKSFPNIFHAALTSGLQDDCVSTLPVRVSQFLGTLGVNVHLEYTDGKYANSANVISHLSYLGINQVRDMDLNPANAGQSSYGVLAAAGARFDLFVGAGRPIAQSMGSIDAFVQAHPGAVESIEGPNEVNNWPITYNGLVGDSAAMAFQSALYAAAKADLLVAGLPVYSLTGTYAVVSGFDFTNTHPYASNGAQPLAAMLSNLSKKQAATGGAPFVITEDGYNTVPNTAGSVDQLTQAKQTLNMLFDAEKLGASKLYIYQLLDAYAPGSKNANDQFGLFNFDGSPKLAAKAIHNLTTLLVDSGATASTFQTTALNYTVSNLPSAGSSLLLEKSNGAYDLVLWSEPTIWNSTTNSEISVAATQTTVSLGAAYGEVKVFDPLTGAAAISDLHGVSQVTVGISDHPLIIEVEPPAAQSRAAGPGTTQAGSSATAAARASNPAILAWATSAAWDPVGAFAAAVDSPRTLAGAAEPPASTAFAHVLPLISQSAIFDTAFDAAAGRFAMLAAGRPDFDTASLLGPQSPLATASKFAA
jgi:hypothetical protein